MKMERDVRIGTSGWTYPHWEEIFYPANQPKSRWLEYYTEHFHTVELNAVEILSPSTSYKDQTEKLLLYEKHGVKEYWIVNPDAKYVMIYRLEGVKYSKPEYLTENDILESRALEGLKIDLSEVWGGEHIKR
jgi:hypothetical protein